LFLNNAFVCIKEKKATRLGGFCLPLGLTDVFHSPAPSQPFVAPAKQEDDNDNDKQAQQAGRLAAGGDGLFDGGGNRLVVIWL